MRVGLYLAYAPFPPNSSIRNEGLGRYLALLIKNFLQEGHTVILACPFWFKEILSELLRDYAIPEEEIELIMPKADPLILKLYYFLKTRTRIKRKSKWRGTLSKSSNQILQLIIELFLSIKDVGILTILVLFILLFFLICTPIIILCTIIILTYKILNRVSRGVFRTNDRITFISLLRLLISLPIINRIYMKINSITQMMDVRETLRELVAKELISRINMMKTAPDVWYCPTAFWSEFGNIKGVTVTCIPDIVINEFALEFAESPYSKVASERLGKSVENNRFFITYCNFIKDSVLISKWGIPDQQIVPIMMFANPLNDFIDVQQSYPHHKNANRIFAKRVLENARIYLTNSINPLYIASDRWCSFKDIKYIFYSSQVRYYKNILALVKAYEYLLRRNKITCKLFLTGNYAHNKQLYQYILDHQLQNDVLCFFNVPNQVLAALYACAELSVNPTLYEGGFPFTLIESMSVGTPVILSRIPQVTEFTDGWDIDDCLFDPYDYEDIADKILFGLNHREALIQKQMPIFKSHMERTESGQAGREYIKAFEYFIELDKKMEKKGGKENKEKGPIKKAVDNNFAM